MKKYLSVYSTLVLYLETGKETVRVRFSPIGNRAKYAGSYSTGDKQIQAAIEKLPEFGYSIILESQAAEKPKVEEAKQYPDVETLQQAKEVLVKEYGQPNNMTAEKVIAKAKELNIEFPNIKTE